MGATSEFSPPTRFTLLIRGLTGRCAVCGTFRLSARWLSISPRCARCDFPIERKEGHFVGAVGMNTIVTFGAILVCLGVGTALTAPDIPALKLSVLTAGIVVLVSVVFFPISKTLWSAIDLIMVALEPGEVNPQFAPPDEETKPGR